ncbi:MAG: acetyltransferase [Candidatus Omnitrophica bacterium]|nr:acetyltransferase [Candidatus Omnitrophota bacterium]MCM8800231.1 acetyltransferase [Candidatus Omnitrophota bacterium]
MIQLFIIGAGRHAVEVYSYIRDLKGEGRRIKVIGLIDENKPADSWEDTEILGDFSVLKAILNKYKNTKFYYITAVGDNNLRQKFVEKINSFKFKNLLPFTLIHPSVLIGRNVKIGEGSLVAPGCILTTYIKIGRHCIINVKSSISHDCNIADFVNINPGVVICGNVNISKGAFIGAGATVIDKIKIGAWSIVGAGSVIIKDVSSNITVAGVPAERIHYKNK